ncbi:hypothetical protein KY363_03250 [Candidatus Woesearchaeota archaeon]|nr:hypothetical protein [Candidatus Woesearchaeota archaeon]
MKILNRKAISPMIAAVLLVVIVVSIGAAVMALVRNYMTEGEQQVTVSSEAIKCGRDVGIDFVRVDNSYQICNGTHESDSNLASLNFVIENTGSVKIRDVQVRAVGTKGIVQNNSVLNDSLSTGGVVIINMSYDPEALGGFRQVKVIPRINLPGQVEAAFCSDAGITVDAVSNNCTTYQ